ncbi:tail fiber domain-containing protein [Sphingobium fuliginis]|uniref:Tail fiber domain-containing protein n=1 Tax=Sphingobium fuliginis (strain ATCC 27551) TaxID=336203 RepID=A0A7M2GJX3_SPHSA|nr:tail fiber domain-containing protein [Sphingobium fuliginis]QOT72828.1 tail fiber domain-containing protein [Sphingobium fuliginis]
MTNNGTTVTGAGTSWTTYVDAGQAFVGPDGLAYEIAAVVSATSLTLASAYKGATASGQAYRIMPVQGYVRDLALSASDLLLSFSSVRDGVGQGKFPDGTVGAPGIRFANDEDTGIYRIGANVIGITTNGTERLRVDASGNVGVGVAPVARLDVANVSRIRWQLTDGIVRETATNASANAYAAKVNDAAEHVFSGSGSEWMRLVNGNAGIGVTPSRLLHIGGRSSPEFLIQSSDAASWKARITFGNAAVKWEMGSDIGNVGDNNFYWYDAVAGAERMRISSNGSLTIGTQTTAPNAFLNVAAGAQVRNNGGGEPIMQTYNTNAPSGSRYYRLVGGNDGGFSLQKVNDAYTSAALCFVWDGAFRPGGDNNTWLGHPSYRWNQLFAGTGTINTSDERAKQDITPIPDEWLDAWAAVDWKRYKFIDAVQAKGDNARWHLGLVAQAVRDAFAEKGLDAERIGLLCFDQWDEQTEPVYETVEIPEVLDDDGNVLEPARTEQQDTGETRVTLEAGDRWGLRYDECFALEAAYQRRRMDRIEAQLEALENTE